MAKIPPNENLSKLASSSKNGDPGDYVGLKGYIGPAEDGAKSVRIYPSLHDLSEYVEVGHDAIVHHEKASEHDLPGGHRVWVKKDSRVTYHREQKVSAEAGMLGGAISRAHLSAQQTPPTTIHVVQGEHHHRHEHHPGTRIVSVCVNCGGGHSHDCAG
jgi:hypothetical protein